MICIGGPMDGHEVNPRLGAVWAYCLNPLMPEGVRRITGTYLRVRDEPRPNTHIYLWQGVDQ